MKEISILSPTELDDAIARAAIYLDVRSVEEFNEGHVPGAFNVPWMHGSLAGLVANAQFSEVVEGIWPRSARLIIGCRTGARARSACTALLALGYAPALDAQGMCGAPDAFGRAGRGFVARGGRPQVEAQAGTSYAELLARARAGNP